MSFMVRETQQQPPQKKKEIDDEREWDGGNKMYGPAAQLERRTKNKRTEKGWRRKITNVKMRGSKSLGRASYIGLHVTTAVAGSPQNPRRSGLASPPTRVQTEGGPSMG